MADLDQFERDVESDESLARISDHFDKLCAHIKDIRDALGTEERGSALIEVARNACQAEQELAALKRRRDDDNDDYDPAAKAAYERHMYLTSEPHWETAGENAREIWREIAKACVNAHERAKQREDA